LRKNLIARGVRRVRRERYFTISGPRQTGKSTYFRLLAEELEKIGYEVLHINVENFMSASEEQFLHFLGGELEERFGYKIESNTFGQFYDRLKDATGKKWVLIIDEIEGLNPEIFGQFLHTIRNLYHFREKHNLKSVVLVGVSNIVGIVQDHASPFNIADNLQVPYFTDREAAELLGMHEEETNQKFSPQVKHKISAITANQPGLVNGFAYQLVKRHPQKVEIDMDDYLRVEDWYLTEAIDKNISNVINKARQHRRFVEKLLFTEEKQKYKINDPTIKFLHAQGLIRKSDEGFVEFWVPIYKKAVFDAFYPFSNGESDLFFRNVDFKTLFKEDRRIDFHSLIANYKDYVKRRSFKYFREKDPETNEYKNLKEAALAYSFETYIQSFLQEMGGKSYLEPHTGLGRCDLLINLHNHEYVIEFKIYRNQAQFQRGKQQLAHYTHSLNLTQGIYLVFVPNTVQLPEIHDKTEQINTTQIQTFIILYDEEKDF
jgi:hypothetical protein